VEQTVQTDTLLTLQTRENTTQRYFVLSPNCDDDDDDDEDNDNDDHNNNLQTNFSDTGLFSVEMGY
jgi:hypothetical protein